MGKKRKYVSPLLLLQSLDSEENHDIIIGGSQDTGGTVGGECWDVIDMLDGDPAGRIIGCDGTHLGYLDINEWVLYDKDGIEVDADDWGFDVDIWLMNQGWECYDRCPELAD